MCARGGAGAATSDLARLRVTLLTPPLLSVDPITVADCTAQLSAFLVQLEKSSTMQPVLQEVLASNNGDQIVALYVFLAYGEGRTALARNAKYAINAVKQMAAVLPHLRSAAQFEAWDHQHPVGDKARPGEDKLQLFKRCCGVGLGDDNKEYGRQQLPAMHAASCFHRQGTPTQTAARAPTGNGTDPGTSMRMTRPRHRPGWLRLTRVNLTRFDNWCI